MEKKIKKLQLNKEVISKLNNSDMVSMEGGNEDKGIWTHFIICGIIYDTIKITLSANKAPCCTNISDNGTCAQTACTPCSNYVSCGKCG